MTRFEPIYQTQDYSALLIHAEYSMPYSEKDVTLAPSVSLPIQSSFLYHHQHTTLLLDSNGVLFENGPTEFSLTKFGIYNQDLTLSIQFSATGRQMPDCLAGTNGPVSLRKRSPRTDFLLRKLSPAIAARNELLTEQLLLDLLQSLPNGTHKEASYTRLKPFAVKQVDAAKDLAHSCFDQELRIADLAAAACLSSYHFSRLFKAVTGLSPYEYLTSIRIEQARHLIQQGAPITEAAFATGFNSLENFSYSFHKHTGTAPSHYKNSKISKAI